MFLRRIYLRSAALLVSTMLAGAAFAVPDDGNSSVAVEEREWEGELVLTIPLVNPMPGDANNDGKVDAKDIVEMVNYIMRKEPLTENGFSFGAADVNGDEVINSADVVSVAKMILDPQ